MIVTVWSIVWGLGTGYLAATSYVTCCITGSSRWSDTGVPAFGMSSAIALPVSAALTVVGLLARWYLNRGRA